jgi:hypothetical protein
MGLKHNTIAHECNAVKRIIEHEFKSLDLIFIIYTPTDNAVTDLNTLVLNHKEKVPPSFLEKSYTEQNGFGLMGNYFLGLHESDKKKTFWPFGRHKNHAYFLINEHSANDKTVLELNIYHLCWHAIYAHIQNQAPQKQTIEQRVYHNLLADIFAAIMLNKTGHISHANRLGRLRCKALFVKETGFMAEYFPLPIACESIMMLLGDAQFSGGTKADKTPVKLALNMTNEVAETFDDESIRQWLGFAKNAQNMTWQNIDRNKILQTAIYTCEDPFVRAMAYLVAEFLNTTPYPISDSSYYNPFTDDEVNERAHYKLCKNQFSTILDDIHDYTQTSEFHDKVNTLINHQEENVKNGVFIGWCIPALKRAQDIFEKLSHTPEIKLYQRIKETQNIYAQAYKSILWKDINHIQNKVIDHTRLYGIGDIVNALEQYHIYPWFNDLVTIFGHADEVK